MHTPANLSTFAPVVFRQNQRSSRLFYATDGHIDTSCSNGSLRNRCLNIDSGIHPTTHFQAHPNLLLCGPVYQPRGASTSF